MNCTYTCILVVIFIIFIVILIYNKYFNTQTNNEYYYPDLYQHSPQKLTTGLYNYKLDGTGGMYVWTSTPVMPLYIPCRKSETYRNMCNYVIGNTKPFISST
jgi:hypothetical protein